MKKFIEQEAKEKADEIAIKVRYSHNVFSRWEDSDENSALGEIEGGRGEVMMGPPGTWAMRDVYVVC